MKSDLAPVRRDTLPDRVAFCHGRMKVHEPLPYHYHRIYEVYYCQCSGVEYLVGNRSILLEPGDMLLFNNFDIHRALPPLGEIYDRSLVLIPPEAVRQNSGETDLLACFRNHDKTFDPLRKLNMEDRDTFVSLHEKGQAAYGKSCYGSDVERRLVLEEVLLFVNRLYRREGEGRFSPDRDGKDKGQLARVRDILVYVDEHLEENLSLDYLSHRFNSTPNGLNRLFKARGGGTVHQYILSRRMEFARLFLSEGRSVTETAASTGYGDLNHFIRIFREKNGMTPGEFARAWRRQG